MWLITMSPCITYGVLSNISSRMVWPIYNINVIQYNPVSVFQHKTTWHGPRTCQWSYIGLISVNESNNEL